MENVTFVSNSHQRPAADNLTEIKITFDKYPAAN